MSQQEQQQVDVERDPFLVLLTDALRAGPGSPEWRRAVSQLRDAGENVDEYKLLIEAREALESGKDYRSVRAGPGFTRKLISSLDQERPASPGGRRRPRTASIIFLSAALVIGTVLILLVYELYPRPRAPGSADDPAQAVDELNHTFLSTDVTSSTFDAGVPLAWRTIGSLPLVAAGGLKPGDAAGGPTNAGYLGGGIVSADPLSPDGTFAVQARLRADRPDGLIPQVFVAAGNDFSPDRATSPREVVWQIQGGEQNAIVDGQIKGHARFGNGSELDVRITFNRDVAQIEVNGQRLWAGANGLGNQPRYVGVRFIRNAGQPAGQVIVQSVRVMKG